jgi:DNA polymerase III delta subunit
VLKIFYGENYFSKRLELAKLKAQFLAENGPYAVKEFWAEDLDSAALLQLLSAGGLFAQKELIIIKKAEDSQELIGKVLDIFKDSTNSPAKDLILEVGNLDKRSKEYKAILKSADLTNFPLQTDYELQKWTSSTAKKLSLNLDQKVLAELVKRSNQNQQEVFTVLNQLKLYGTEDTIQIEDLDSFIPALQEDTAFSLLEYALLGKDELLLNNLSSLKLSQSDPYQVIALLCGQIYSLAAVAAVLGNSKHGALKDLASQLGLHPYAASQQESLLRRARLNTNSSLSTVIGSISKLDSASKSIKALDLWAYLELSLLKLKTV